MENKVSLTRMIAPYKNKGLTRDMTVNFLVSWGFIKDIRTITDKGELSGIEYAYGDNGNKWPVYGDTIQRLIEANVYNIIFNYSKAPEAANAPQIIRKVDVKQSRTAEEAISSPSVSSGKYKYLGIDEDFVILDTETTGLNEDDEVIELSVVSATGKELYHSRYYPSKEVSRGAMMVNHMSRRKLQGCPLFNTEWEKIIAAIGNHKIMGHNIEFDKKMIKQTLLKQNCPDDKVEILFKDMIDTMEIAKTWITNRSYSLNNLTTLIGITREEQHKSTDDCRMTLEFINRLEDVIKIRREYSFIR